MEILLGLVAIAYGMVLCGNACKFDTIKEVSRDASGNVIDNENRNVWNSTTPLGFGVGGSFIVDYFLALNEITYKGQPTVDCIINTVIFVLAEVIGFIIFFYIVYGIMSVVKAYGNDEQARRKTAAWITVVLSFICIAIYSA